MQLGEAFPKRKDKIFLDELGFGQVRDVEVAKIREAVERSDVCVRLLSDERVGWGLRDVYVRLLSVSMSLHNSFLAQHCERSAGVHHGVCWGMRCED